MKTASGKCQHKRIIVTDADPDERHGCHFYAFCADCDLEGPTKPSPGEARSAFPGRKGSRPKRRRGVSDTVQLGFDQW